jgi:hypothetical protein
MDYAITTKEGASALLAGAAVMAVETLVQITIAEPGQS